jgi:putative ABC transport system permease protein
VDPIGRRVRRGGASSSEPWITIVGVVGDVRHLGPDRQPVPELFLPHAQVPWPRLTAMIRTDVSPLSFSRLLGDIVHGLGPGYEVGTIQPIERFVTSSIATRRLAAQLLSLFGLLATVVAAVGIYTVMTFGVVQRTQEFGVRIALGARMAVIARVVLAQSAASILVGIILGLMASGALAGVVGSLLYEVSPRDAISFAGASVLLLGVGLAASYLPLRRVFRIDPSAVLRNE